MNSRRRKRLLNAFYRTRLRPDRDDGPFTKAQEEYLRNQEALFFIPRWMARGAIILEHKE
jgi:hypothetical protein